MLSGTASSGASSRARPGRADEAPRDRDSPRPARSGAREAADDGARRLRCTDRGLDEHTGSNLTQTYFGCKRNRALLDLIDQIQAE